MKFHLLVAAIICFANASAQTTERLAVKSLRRNNTVYAELGGTCVYYSLNYQRNIPIAKKLDIAAGISLGPVYMMRNLSYSAQWSPRIALQAQAVYKTGRHEIGAGPALCWYTYRYPKNGNAEAYYEEVQSAVCAQAGYSYTTKAGLYLGAYLTPVLFDVGYFDFMPWAGLRIGYRF